MKPVDSFVSPRSVSFECEDAEGTRGVVVEGPLETRVCLGNFLSLLEILFSCEKWLGLVVQRDRDENKTQSEFRDNEA